MPRRARLNLQRARGTSAAPASARSDPRSAEEIRRARASRSFLSPYRIKKITPTPFIRIYSYSLFVCLNCTEGIMQLAKPDPIAFDPIAFAP